MGSKIIIHEKRNMCMLSLVFTVVILWMLRCFYIHSINEYKNEILNVSMQNYVLNTNLFSETMNEMAGEFLLLFAVPIIFLAVLQYRELKEQRAGEFVRSLPVTKRQVFRNKIIIGMFVYTIPWVVFSAGILLTRIQYNQWFQEYIASCNYAGWILGSESVGNLMIYLLYIWCALTLMYGVVVFVQNICSRPWIAGIISLGMLVFPSMVKYCFTQYSESVINPFWWEKVFLVGVPAENLYVWDSGVQEAICFTYYESIVWVMLLMGLLALAFLTAAYYMFVIRDASKNQGFIYIPWMREVLCAGICFSFVLYLCKVGLEMDLGRTTETMILLIGTMSAYMMIHFIQRRHFRKKGGKHVL